MGKGREALVACSDRSMGTGISIWDLQTGDRILHIPSCAAPPRGLLCLKDQFLLASQINKHGSVGGGAVFAWQLSKPQSPILSYPIEAIGPISCTADGVYLAGGAASGNAYIWEVASGKLLKTWHAHQTSLKCMVFSYDDSLLISGSDDGMICVWSMLSVLDVENLGSRSSLLCYTSEHKSSISSLLTASGSSSSTFISSSLDATCKAWDLTSGRLVQTQEYPLAITAVILHPAEQFLFAGSTDGRIFMSEVNFGLMDDPLGDQLVVLEGHKESITSLTFSTLGLISASEDGTIRLWDATSWVTIRRFNYQKGAVTNVLVIPQSSLLPLSNHQRVQQQFHISLLEKCLQPVDSSKGTVALLRSCFSLEDNQTFVDLSASSLDQQIFEMERECSKLIGPFEPSWHMEKHTSCYIQIVQQLEECTPAASQMKVETSIEQRMWATRMTKHVMEMNKQLQSRLLDMMQIRLLWKAGDDSPTTRKNKKHKIESPPHLEDKPFQSSN